MGKAAIIVLGAVIIGTALGVYFGNTFGLLPAGGLPIVCGLIGLIISTILVAGIDVIRRSAARRAPPSTPSADKPPDTAKP